MYVDPSGYATQDYYEGLRNMQFGGGGGIDHGPDYTPYYTTGSFFGKGSFFFGFFGFNNRPKVHSKTGEVGYWETTTYIVQGKVGWSNDWSTYLYDDVGVVNKWIPYNEKDQNLPEWLVRKIEQSSYLAFGTSFIAICSREFVPLITKFTGRTGRIGGFLSLTGTFLIITEDQKITWGEWGQLTIGSINYLATNWVRNNPYILGAGIFSSVIDMAGGYNGFYRDLNHSQIYYNYYIKNK